MNYPGGACVRVAGKKRLNCAIILRQQQRVARLFKLRHAFIEHGRRKGFSRLYRAEHIERVGER